MTPFPAVPVPIDPLPPWQRPDFLPSAPLDSYGYLSDHGRRECTLEDLRREVALGPDEDVHFVWQPGLGRCVPTGEASAVFDVLRQAQLAQASGRRSVFAGDGTRLHALHQGRRLPIPEERLIAARATAIMNRGRSGPGTAGPVPDTSSAKPASAAASAPA